MNATAAGGKISATNVVVGRNQAQSQAKMYSINRRQFLSLRRRAVLRASLVCVPLLTEDEDDVRTARHDEERQLSVEVRVVGRDR
jgi:hypothetical protein